MTDTRNEIGPPRPTTDMLHGVYVGDDPTLRGKGTLVSRTAAGELVAQFDDQETGYGAGWHRFNESDIKLDEHAA